MELPDLLVVHDDIDQPFAQLRFHIRRGPGGHNGIKSIHQYLGTDAYARLKLGVGRPTHPGQDVADFVLEDFTKSEQKALPEFLGAGSEATAYFIKHGIEGAANKFNAVEKKEL